MKKLLSMKVILKSDSGNLEFITSIYKTNKERRRILEFYITDNDKIYDKVNTAIDRNTPHMNTSTQMEKLLEIMFRLNNNQTITDVMYSHGLIKMLNEKFIGRRLSENEEFDFDVNTQEFRGYFYNVFEVTDSNLLRVEFEFSSGRKQIIILVDTDNNTEGSPEIIYFERK